MTGPPRLGPPRAAILLLVLALVLPACGRKGPPLAPELVRPLPPSELVASRTREGVTLTWRRPTRTTGGRSLDDLARFVVERAREPEDFVPVAEIPVEDGERFRPATRFEWRDPQPPVAARLRYRVVAVTRGGLRSAPAGPAELEAEASPRAGPPADPR